MSDYPEFEERGFCNECGFVVYLKIFRYEKDPTNKTRAIWYCSNSDCKRSKHFEASYFKGSSRLAFIPDWVNIHSFEIFFAPPPISSQPTFKAEPITNDLILGIWQGGDPYELKFINDVNNTYYAICTKESPINHGGNSFKVDQILFKDVEFSDYMNFNGNILVPMQSGDQTWFHFTGTINGDEISVSIGKAKWGWGYKRLSY